MNNVVPAVPRIIIIMRSLINLLGINRLEAQPLTHLLGCPVQCTIVPLESIPEFQKSKSGGSDFGSPVLVIKDLPTGHMPEAQIERSLKIQFKMAGHKVKGFIIKGNEAQVTFEDNECKK